MDLGISISIIGAGVGLITLAVLVGSMFYWAGRLASRMDALGARLDALGVQLGGRIDAQGAQLGARIDALGQQLGGRIDDIGQRLDRQGERLEAHGTQLAALGAEVAVVGVRMDGLSAEVSTTRQELLAAISHHEHDTDGNVRFLVPPAAGD